MNDLPKDAIRIVLEYVGQGQFFPLAMCGSQVRALQVEYKQMFGTTSMIRDLFVSIPLAKLILEEVREKTLGRQLWCEIACKFAAYHGNVALLHWLAETEPPTGYGSSCEMTEAVSKECAKQGHLKCLQWARANGCEWDSGVCTYATRNVHLDVLQWARANGCDWDKYVCTYAALNSHMEILQWDRANGCRWNESVCSNAVRNGHLEILQWARANGCDWDKYVCSNAALNGHMEILQCAQANGCDQNSDVYT